MQNQFLKWLNKQKKRDWLSQLLKAASEGDYSMMDNAPSPYHSEADQTMMSQRKTMGPPKRNSKLGLSRSIIQDRSKMQDVSHMRAMNYMDISNIRNTTKKGSIIGSNRGNDIGDMKPKQLVLTVYNHFINQKEDFIDSLYGGNEKKSGKK